MRNLRQKLSKLLPARIHPRTLARNRVMRRAGGKVIAGPFEGMRHLTSKDDFIEPAMLMGCYEKELHPAFEAWLADPPDLFIDVGAAQGYYSVGLARRAPRARHIAFEMDEERIAQLKRTAAANDVQVEVWGTCDAARLCEALRLGASSAVIVDVEGYELELLKDDVLESLRNTRLIIETHDHIIPGITSELERRFEPSHEIEVVRLRLRTTDDLPFQITDRWTLKQIDEGRTDMQQKFLVLTPKAPN